MEKKEEMVGEVLLDYTWYSGEDLYSDGDIEDKLLQIVTEHAEEELNTVIAREKDWAVLYHLSHIRENILGGISFTGKEEVLEIGSGCGAVTGALLNRAAHVTGVDLSRRRCMINARRHRDAGNLKLVVGNFRDIEPNLPTYDVVTLIGVFEYAAAYMGTKDPYGDFLELARRHLKKGGRLIIAIENRLGLKYWAGCAEDHSGRFFDGIEGYPDGEGRARTFSREELQKLFTAHGFTWDRFYYPYPDYKLPMVIYSDAYGPGRGQLRQNRWNFDRRRLLLFDEDLAFDSLAEGGAFPDFSNSFLVILKTDGGGGQAGHEPVYTRFSNERAGRFALMTQIEERADGRARVTKTACRSEGRKHIKEIAEHEKALLEMFDGTDISVNRVTGLDEENGSITLDYLPGMQTLEERAAALIGEGDTKGGMALIRAWCSEVEALADTMFTFTEPFGEVFGLRSFEGGGMSLPVTDIDMVAENVMLDRDRKILIDYEWTYTFPVPVRFVVFRIWYYFAARCIGEEKAASVCLEEGFTVGEISCFLQMEKAWQAYVTAGHTPLRELFAAVTPGEIDVRRLAGIVPEGDRTEKAGQMPSRLYYTREGGTDFAEYVTGILSLTPDGRFEVKFSLEAVPANARLRWDPVEGRLCRIRIDRVLSTRMVNIFPANGFRGGDGTDTFWTMDPAYNVEGIVCDDKELQIGGTLEFTDPYAELEKIEQLNRERDAYFAEMQSLRERIGAIRGTKAYKAAEGLRRVRNFTMARVRGTKMFRDKNAGPKKYQEWLRDHMPDEQELAAQRMIQIPDAPKISLLVPVYRTKPEYLRAMIDSVLAQTYANWELCIADGSVEKDGETARILGEYAGRDRRILVRVLDENGGISVNTNEAAKLAGGSYVAMLDHDDMLAPNALFEAASAIVRTGAKVLYTDEDKVNMLGTDHFEPNLKPDFSPDLLRSHNYITHLFIVSRELFDRVGGFRKEFDGAQDHDLILRCCERAETIVHIPKILYHWRSHPQSTAQDPESKTYAYEAGRRAVSEHLKRLGIPASVEPSGSWGISHVRYDVPEDALISVIIPNCDHVKDLDRCLESLFGKSDFTRFEVIVVENNSRERETFAYYRRAKKKWDRLRVVRWDGPFNYAAVNNYGASYASGQYLLLLNNDTELMMSGSLREMAGFCSRPDVGCVGAKLLYPDNTVQHAGIVLGFGGFAGHVFVGIGSDSPGFMMRPLMACNYSAVTAACLMVRKSVFDSVGGLDERYAVALNDVDFCLKVRRAGYLNVYTPWSLWHHYESATRGYEDTPEKKERFAREVALFRQTWAEELKGTDPYYNPNFSLDHAPFSLW